MRTLAPMRSSKGRNASCRNSKGGAKWLCVPPASVTLLGCFAMQSGSKIVCRMSMVLPAEPIEKSNTPPCVGPGSKVKAVEPSSAPCV